MTEQLYYEDVAIGTEVPSSTHTVSLRQMVHWAGASGEFFDIHFDREAARAKGFADVVVNGRLKVVFLVEMISSWVGEQGMLRRFAVRHRGLDFVQQPIICYGRVTAKYDKDGEHWLECEVWTENPQGTKTATGSLAMTVPSRVGEVSRPA